MKTNFNTTVIYFNNNRNEVEHASIIDLCREYMNSKDLLTLQEYADKLEELEWDWSVALEEVKKVWANNGIALYLGKTKQEAMENLEEWIEDCDDEDKAFPQSILAKLK